MFRQSCLAAVLVGCIMFLLQVANLMAQTETGKVVEILDVHTASPQFGVSIPVEVYGDSILGFDLELSCRGATKMEWQENDKWGSGFMFWQDTLVVAGTNENKDLINGKIGAIKLVFPQGAGEIYHLNWHVRVAVDPKNFLYHQDEFFGETRIVTLPGSGSLVVDPFFSSITDSVLIELGSEEEFGTISIDAAGVLKPRGDNKSWVFYPNAKQVADSWPWGKIVMDYSLNPYKTGKVRLEKDDIRMIEVIISPQHGRYRLHSHFFFFATRGDLNMDGKIEILDAGMVLDHVFGNGYLHSSYQRMVADTDRNTEVDLMDAVWIVDYVLGTAGKEDIGSKEDLVSKMERVLGQVASLPISTAGKEQIKSIILEIARENKIEHMGRIMDLASPF